MEIISVIRGDDPSDPWKLSPSTKGIIPFNPLYAQIKNHLFHRAVSMKLFDFHFGDKVNKKMAENQKKR